MSEQKVDLYNPHNGLTGRDGGPYLDQEERRLAEIVRSAKEEREPDFDNAPATAGTPLVTAATLVNMANPASNPSQANTADSLATAVTLLADNENFPATPHASREQTEAEKEADRLAESNDPHDNPASPTVVSTDEETKEGVEGTSNQDLPEVNGPEAKSETKSEAKTEEKKTEAKPAAKTAADKK